MKLPTKEVQSWYDGEGNLKIANYDNKGNILPLGDVHCENVEIEGSIKVLSPIRGTFLLNDSKIGESVLVIQKEVRGGVKANNVQIEDSLALESTRESPIVGGKLEIRKSRIGTVDAPHCNFETVDALQAKVEHMFFFLSIEGPLILKDAEIEIFEFEGHADLDLRGTTIEEHRYSTKCLGEDALFIQGDHKLSKDTDIPNSLQKAIEEWTEED